MRFSKNVDLQDVESFHYQTHNMIIEYNDEAIGAEFGSQEEWEKWHDEYYSGVAIKERAEEAKRIHEKIMSEW